MISLQELKADDWPTWRALRLEALREAPYAFGSTLAEWQGAGDCEARWRERLSSVPLNIMARLDGTPAGIASGTHPSADGEVELISMWVAPFARGQRVGDALVGAVLHWAAQQGASRVTLAVVQDNDHAIALYRRHGFIDAGCADDGERTMVCSVLTAL